MGLEYTLTIKFDKINLTKCLDSGLYWMLDILLAEDEPVSYQRAAKVRDEINRRNSLKTNQ